MSDNYPRVPARDTLVSRVEVALDQPNPTRESRASWLELAEKLNLPQGLFIDGDWVEPRSRQFFDSVSPVDGRVIAAVARGHEADVDLAVRAGRAAFERGNWSKAAPEVRKAGLLKLADLVEGHSAELALLDALETGKLVNEALELDLPDATQVLRWFAEATDKVYDEVAPARPDEVTMITREPLGVVGCVVPWNFPLQLAVWKLAPALACGNSVVLKPAEESSLSALRLAQLASEAGIPDGVLGVVPGLGPEAGRALGLHSDVDAIAFTGSTEVGKLFLQYSGASNMKPVWLECGGKSPILIFADADLDEAARRAAEGIFFNQGQVCSATSRLLVEEGVRAEVLERVEARAEALVVGDPLEPETEMGPVVSEAHANRVAGFIERGQESARLLAGGGRKGCFIEPTVFEDADGSSELSREEVFGPVLTVVPFPSEEDAIHRANSTRYGLAASIWTNNLSRAHRLSRELRAGTVWVNTVDALSPQAPFGGFGESGFGRDLSLHALDKYTGIKTTRISLS